MGFLDNLDIGVSATGLTGLGAVTLIGAEATGVIDVTPFGPDGNNRNTGNTNPGDVVPDSGRAIGRNFGGLERDPANDPLGGVVGGGQGSESGIAGRGAGAETGRDLGRGVGGAGVGFLEGIFNAGRVAGENVGRGIDDAINDDSDGTGGGGSGGGFDGGSAGATVDSVSLEEPDISQEEAERVDPFNVSGRDSDSSSDSGSDSDSAGFTVSDGVDLTGGGSDMVSDSKPKGGSANGGMDSDGATVSDGVSLKEPDISEEQAERIDPFGVTR